MFAPNYHSAMKHVGPARKKMGKKTIFNLNWTIKQSSSSKKTSCWSFHKKWMMPFAEALRENNVLQP